MALIEVVNKAILLSGFVRELDLTKKKPSVFCDSWSTIHLTKNQMYHDHTKHIDLRYHFIQDIIS